MKELILPGYSIKNKGWAYALAEQLHEHKFGVIEWSHWSVEGSKFSALDETKKLVSQLQKEDSVVIVAKSVGTLVCVLALPSVSQRVEKLVLLGIPLRDLDLSDRMAYCELDSFPQQRLLVIQNSQDNHGTYQEVAEFLAQIDPGIKVISKGRTDHEYPYPEEIGEFLRD